MQGMDEEDRRKLADAKKLLENPSFFIRLSDKLGKPIEAALDKLPERARDKIARITRRSLENAALVAIRTLGSREALDSAPPKAPKEGLHKLMAAGMGAAGGALGLPGLALELPVSTVLMLRSIADIGRTLGEDLNRVEARIECLQVFAFGGPSQSDNAAESAYFAVRMALAAEISKAVQFLAGRGAAGAGKPALMRAITAIAERFSITVSEKAVAQAMPIVGALGGATVNTLFMNHFQAMAKGHFTVRSLERRHDPEIVRRTYGELPSG